MAQPVIDAVELTTRHNEFLRQIRHAFNPRFPAEMQRAFKEAEETYTAWFAERGVTLVFED